MTPKHEGTEDILALKQLYWELYPKSALLIYSDKITNAGDDYKLKSWMRSYLPSKLGKLELMEKLGDKRDHITDNLELLVIVENIIFKYEHQE